MIITRYIFEPVIEGGAHAKRKPKVGEYIKEMLTFRIATKEDASEEYFIYSCSHESYVKRLPLKDLLNGKEQGEWQR